jgi:peptidyl-prolyl cis-trans isomerase D
MLVIMRKYKQSIVIKAVFAIIVFSFIGTIFLIWGKGDEGMGSSDFAVKVDRTVITYDEFQKTYGNLRAMYQQTYGEAMTPELEKMMGLKTIVLDRLINTSLIHNEAKRMGVKVSDDEVVSAIAAIPAFQKNGVFDRQLYLALLQDKRLTPQSFEKSEKQDLLIKKTITKITEQAKVTDAEALQFFKKRHDKINLLFTSFSPAEVRTEVKLTEQDLAKYLQNNQETFKTPAQVSISYALLPPAQVAAGLSVSDEEVQDYYRKNIDRYQEKGSILPFEAVSSRVKTDALQFKASKQAYELAANALNKSLPTADLNAAARLMGVKVEKTGLFSAKQPPAALASESEVIQKAFALKPGELGGPVETKKGVYLFTVNEKKPVAVPPLAQIRPQVEKLATDAMAQTIAQRKAEQALEQLKKGQSGLNVQESGFFTYAENGQIPKIGTVPMLMESAFNLSKESPVPAQPLKIGDRWYAYKLQDRTTADTADFQKTKEQIKQSMLPQKQQEVTETWLKGLRSKAKITINPLLQAE